MRPGGKFRRVFSGAEKKETTAILPVLLERRAGRSLMAIANPLAFSVEPASATWNRGDGSPGRSAVSIAWLDSRFQTRTPRIMIT